MSFLANTLVVLRESLEAILIVGILIGLVTKIGRPAHRRTIFWGAAAGVVGSLVLGFVLLALADTLRERYEVAFEAVASLVAVAVLTYMVVWMYRHTQEFMGTAQGRLRSAIEEGTVGALFFLPFIAVLREGFETVLILAADGAPMSSLLGSVLIGLGVAAVLGALLFSGVIRLNIRWFFAVTGFLLVLFAASMLQYGIHELGEIVEGRYHEAGELLEGPLSWVAAAVYLLAFGFWYLRPIVKTRPTPSPTPVQD